MKFLLGLLIFITTPAFAKDPVLVAVVDMGVDYYRLKELRPFMYENSRWDHGWDFGNNEPSSGTDYNYQNEGTHHGTFIAFLISNKLNPSTVKILDVVYSDFFGNQFKLNQYMFPENNLEVYRKKKAFEKFSEHLGKTFEYAEQTGARVINFSSSDRGFHSESLKEYLKSAQKNKTFFVVSAGNDGDSLTEIPQYPCNYDLPNVICVGAVDKKNNKTTYSNYGNGVDIYALGNFGQYEGTSFSAPIISKSLALIIKKHPNWSINRVRTELFKYVFYKKSLPIFNHKEFNKRYLNIVDI